MFIGDAILPNLGAFRESPVWIPAPGGGTPTLLFDGITGQANNWSFGDATAGYYAGLAYFTTGSAITVTKIVVPLLPLGNPTGKTFVARIWTDSSNDLGTEIGTSDSIAGAVIAAYIAVTDTDFVFSTPVALSASTNYHITIDTGAVDVANAGYAQFTTPSVIPGQLSRFSSSGVNQFPATFPTFDLQLAIWGT